MGFNLAFKGLKLLKKTPRERVFKQFKLPRPQCVNQAEGTYGPGLESLFCRRLLQVIFYPQTKNSRNRKNQVV